MPEMAQQPSEFWHSFISSPEPGHFPPKTEREGGEELLPHIPDGREDADLVLHKLRAEPYDSSRLSSLSGEGSLDCHPP